MPNRFATRVDRKKGPAPFSSEWLQSPDTAPPTRPLLELPEWAPDERTVSAAMVILLALTIAAVAALRPSAPVDPSVVAGLAATPPATVVAPGVDVGREVAVVPPTVAPIQTLAPPTPTPTFVPAPVVATAVPTAAAETLPGSLLPANRILTYYGHPHDSNMGILGEHEREDLLRLLREEAANYEAVDPSRPVIPAFEVIATVAQRDPGYDGTYILDTDLATLTEYADFAEANGMLLFLDLQIGRGTVAAEIEKVLPLLERPYVHLALDPEFVIAEGETPGIHIGSLPAESITYAQQTLARLVAEKGLPPKVLIVHQFREDMIGDKMSLLPVAGVQLVIDADGYGDPELKTAVYNFLVRDEPVEYAGIKLFYKQDRPMMTAAEILGLTPPPDLIIYQ